VLAQVQSPHVMASPAEVLHQAAVQDVVGPAVHEQDRWPGLPRACAVGAAGACARRAVRACLAMGARLTMDEGCDQGPFLIGPQVEAVAAVPVPEDRVAGHLSFELSRRRSTTSSRR